MNSSLRPRITVHHRVPHVPPPADGVVPAVDDHDPAATDCGWYASSFALRQGLVVRELDASDGQVAALWFAQQFGQPLPGALQ